MPKTHYKIFKKTHTFGKGWDWKLKCSTDLLIANKTVRTLNNQSFQWRDDLVTELFGLLNLESKSKFKQTHTFKAKTGKGGLDYMKPVEKKWLGITDVQELALEKIG